MSCLAVFVPSSQESIGLGLHKRCFPKCTEMNGLNSYEKDQDSFLSILISLYTNAETDRKDEKAFLLSPWRISPVSIPNPVSKTEQSNTLELTLQTNTNQYE